LMRRRREILFCIGFFVVSLGYLSGVLEIRMALKAWTWVDRHYAFEPWDFHRAHTRMTPRT
jgi:hypothetical protein